MARSTRAQLETLKESLIRSGGVGGKTTAEDLRTFQTAVIDSLLNILDDQDENDGYLAIDTSGRVDVTKINSSNSGTIKQVLNSDGTWKNSYSSQVALSGTGVQTTFTVTHGGGFIPHLAIVTPGSIDAAVTCYTNNYTLATFDVVFLTPPIAGVANLRINYIIE